jgi:dihydrolipoamide dehydrogenase
MTIYDYGIIGGGPAGYSAAIYAVKEGKSVILFEKDKIGGTCLNRGCIPTKTFLHWADLYSDFKSGVKKELFRASELGFDFEKIADEKARVCDSLRKSLELVLKTMKITVINSEANIENGKILANNETYECKEVIVATGAKPRELQGLEFDGEFILSSDDILDLRKCPKKIIILGSGAIGIEWARILSAFDTEVTIVEMAKNLLPLADIEVSKRVERIFKKQGIKYYTETSVVSANKAAKTVTLSNGETLETELLFIAAGRVPNKINANNLIGDCCGEIQLAHYATSQARNIILGIPYDKELIPSVVYGEPEIAWVGKREQDGEFKKINLPITALGKAQCDNATEGFIKLLLDGEKIVGAHIVSKEASALIQQLVIAIQNNIPVERLKEVCWAHPTYSEGIFEGLMRL